MSTPGLLQGLASRIGVWYLGQKNIATFLEAMGLVCDGAADGAIVGCRRSFPYRCTPDAFPDLSKDRKIRRYPNESEASFRWRAAHWRQIRRTRGCHYGEMANAQPYFLPGSLPRITIVHQAGDGSSATWHTLSTSSVYSWARATPSNFDYDGQWSKWSRWWAFIDMGTSDYAAPNTYDSGGLYDDSGWIYDSSTFKSSQMSDIVTMFQEAKAPHSWLAGVILVWPSLSGAAFPGAFFVPNQDLSGWWSLPNGANTWSVLVDPATNKPTRPPNFTWIYDNPAP